MITGPFILLLKPRLPETGASASAKTNWSLLRSPLFWTYSLSIFAMVIGYFYSTAIGPLYYRGALCLGLRNSDTVDAAFVVLSDAHLSRTTAEVDHPCPRCAKSLALGVDCVRGHKACERCQSYNRSGCQFVSGVLRPRSYRVRD